MINKQLTINRISASILTILALSIWILSADFKTLENNYPGPSLFPRLIAICMLLSSIILFLSKENSVSSQTSSQEKSKTFPWSFLLFLLIGASFPILFSFTGFYPCIFLFALGAGFLMKMDWKTVILVAGATTGIIYLLFGLLLSIPL